MVSGVNTLKVDLVDKMGSDLTVVNAARVSFAKKSDWDHSIPFADGNELKDTDARLIKYLAKHNHWSPFAHIITVSYQSTHIRCTTVSQTSSWISVE